MAGENHSIQTWHEQPPSV